jgi:CRP/FNR family transcriptional regulator, nitrogen fixation regulation protein
MSKPAVSDVRRREEESVIIRNSSSVRVNEPIWTRQRDAAPKCALSGLDSLAVRARYARGQKIYKEHSAVECWYRIESGVARRFSTRADGRRQIVDLLLPGDVFGFGARGRHHFEVEAVIEDTLVARYPRSRLEALAESDARTARELREAACEAMSRLYALILNLGRTTAEQKVGHFLVKIAERLPDGPADGLTLPLSREDIADYLALSVETVSRALTQLKRRGMIRLTGTRQIRILDRNTLAGSGEEHLPMIDGPLEREPHSVRRIIYSDYS